MRRVFFSLLAGWASATLLALAQTTPLYTVTTIAGIGRLPYPGDGRAATSVSLFEPNRVAYDRDGNLYFTETYYHRVFRVSTSGILSVLAGNGEPDFGGDGGAATAAGLGTPLGVAVDAARNVYVGTTNRIRRISPDGVIRTIAGNGEQGYFGNGVAATSARLNTPWGVAVDSSGNVYIADIDNHRVRKVSSTGVIADFAGNGERGHDGDGGPALQARLDFPSSVAVDGAGNVFIASYRYVRRVTPNGLIATVAGNGEVTFSGDGDLATRAGMTAERLAIDDAGRIYVSDRGNRRIRRLDPVQIFASGVLNGATFLSGAVAPVPYSVAGKSSTVMQVTYRGRKTNTVTLPVADSSPGLFAVSGRGQAAALNQDWSVNSAGNPAARDTIIMLYATGEGQTRPPGVDGKRADADFPEPILPVSVTIGGVEAQVLYAGAAPLMVAGAMQVNVRVPATAPAGDAVLIRLKVGSKTSPEGLTVAVK